MHKKMSAPHRLLALLLAMLLALSLLPLTALAGTMNFDDWSEGQIPGCTHPTDKQVTTVLKSNPDLTGAETSETVTLAPGGVIVREFK